MHFNFIHYDISSCLPILMRNVLEGTEQGSRNGRTKELAHVGITLREPWRREILLPERKSLLAAQIAETAWVLAGRNDLEFLNHYLPRAAEYSDDGTTWRGGYGPRIRRWYSAAGLNDLYRPIDQLQHVVDQLRENPLERRAVIGIYDPSIDTQPGKDIPCNDFLMFTNRLGKLDMQVVIRSNDLMWGWSGINAFEWSVLQEIVAGMIGVQVGALHFSIASLHLYQPYWDKAERIAQLGGIEASDAERLDSPRFNATGMDDTSSLDYMLNMWFEAEEAIRTGSTLAPQLVADFPEPMFQSWLRVLQWWWSGDMQYLDQLIGTRLHRAAELAMQPAVVRFGEGNVMRGTTFEVTGGATHRGIFTAPVGGEMLDEDDTERVQYAVDHGGTVPSHFLLHAINTHNEKHQAYGDSWCRRGEMLGIMANIARKVDRLGGAETSDETSADTAMDLMVYLAKYRAWLEPHSRAADEREHYGANDALRQVEQEMSSTYEAVDMAEDRTSTEDMLRAWFDDLETLVTNNNPAKAACVWTMLSNAYMLARHLYEQQPAEYQGADAD